MNYAFEPPATVTVPVADTGTHFPVNRVYCVGRNYREHAREMGASLREPPFFFSKPADALCSHEEIPYPGMTGKLQHEVELVVALQSGGSELSVDDARSAIFGYAVGVDLTRRDLQAEAKKSGRPWVTAKSFDHSAPISPIRPVGESGHPGQADIQLAVNGEPRQQGNIADMTWAVPEVLAELSRYFELKPGDLVFTGTPAGVGDLHPGDRVQCDIEKVGSLRFVICPV